MAPVLSTQSPLSGLNKPFGLENLVYGPGCVEKHLLSLLPSANSKVLIMTGKSLMNKTPLIKKLETLLGSKHAATFAEIGQHAPVADLDRATKIANDAGGVDTVLSVGGGSPIDASKCLSFRHRDSHGRFLYHISIPTTGSAAEVTSLGAYTNEEGTKVGVPPSAELAVKAILYDPEFIAYTPKHLFLSTAVRAVDHSIEMQYYPTATPVTQAFCAAAARELFTWLPKAHASFPEDPDVITRVMLACYMSLAYLGINLKGSLGWSHVLGYALGSPYQIPHGTTSCIALAPVIEMISRTNEKWAGQIGALLDFLPGKNEGPPTGKTGKGAVEDCKEVGRRVSELIKTLGLQTSLTEQNVPKGETQVIVKRAMKAMAGLGAMQEQKEETPEEKKLRDELQQLVQGLW